MKELDKKDCLILNILQENCRISLTDISKKVGLSIDSIKKRMKRMIKDEIFYPKIQIRPRNFGFKNIVDIKIKIHDYNEEDKSQFINFLEKNPYVAEIFSVSGDWDFSIVIITKDAEDLGSIIESIRNKFSYMISDWSESLTTHAYKFETYDLIELMGFKEGIQ